ncbi:MAG: DNA polymerase I [Desulfomonilia bacterium]
MSQPRDIYLIDGSSYIYRAFYAMRNLSTSKGMPTNAIFILSRMLLKLLKEKNPHHICFVLDSRGPTHRHEIYEDYKGTRPTMPEALQVQFPYILDVVSALGIPVVQREGFEADDIIATLARRSPPDTHVIIVSGDKDLMQLVNESVTVWDTLKDKLYDRDGVREKFGVYPEYIADLLAIMGDSSDNIPGIPGIGQKGATELISRFGHLDSVLDHAGQIQSDKTRKALEEGRQQGLLGLELVRLDTEVDLPMGEEDLAVGDMDRSRLAQIFTELEFKALLNDIQEEGTALKPAFEGEIVQGIPSDLSGDLGMFILPGLGSAVFAGGKHYVSLDSSKYLDPLTSPGVRICLHDAKEALVAAMRSGLEVRAEIFDTMLAAYCIDAATGTTSLEDLSRAYVEREIPSLKEVLGTGKNARAVQDLNTDQIETFLAGHSQVLLPLEAELREHMKRVGVDTIFSRIEMPLVEVLASMEVAGVLIDTDLLADISKEISLTIRDMETQIYRIADKEFNINSPKQLGEVLFEDLKLPVVKKTKTGYSTDSQVLASLASKHELPAVILDYRMLAKLKNTYVDALPAMVDPVSRRIHTRFNQAITATGRISSSEPNLQNIPIRTDTGRRIRQAFIAPEGHWILSADYSQIELRILAHITKDKTLMEAFSRNIDIHAQTASQVFGIPLEEVSENQRRQAKTINFGIMYGMGPHKLSGELGIKREVARQYIENYLSNYPGVRRYMEQTAQEASHSGYVTTIMGRRRSIPEINSSNFNEREGARRIAINTPIQGSAADFIKMAMVKIYQGLASMKSRMILQIHDELVFEVSDDELETVKALVQQEMETAHPLDVPVRVDVGVGKNWAEAH